MELAGNLTRVNSQAVRGFCVCDRPKTPVGGYGYAFQQQNPALDEERLLDSKRNRTN